MRLDSELAREIISAKYAKDIDVILQNNDITTLTHDDIHKIITNNKLVFNGNRLDYFDKSTLAKVAFDIIDSWITTANNCSGTDVNKPKFIANLVRYIDFDLYRCIDEHVADIIAYFYHEMKDKLDDNRLKSFCTADKIEICAFNPELIEYFDFSKLDKEVIIKRFLWLNSKYTLIRQNLYKELYLKHNLIMYIDDIALLNEYLTNYSFRRILTKIINFEYIYKTIVNHELFLNRIKENSDKLSPDAIEQFNKLGVYF